MKFFLRSFFFIILGSLATLSFGFWQMMKNLPDPRFLEHYTPSSMTYIYDRNGRLMQEWGNEYRAFTSYSNIPNLLIQAFLSAEDKYFFQHPGVDFISLTRSLIHNFENKTVIGGSTITQQVAKNFVIGDEKTFLRKIKEAILAFKIEYYLSKSKILEIYLNHIYLGKKTFGVTAAAKKYFDKTLKELKPGDMAFLAALAKYPSAQNKTRVIQRRNWILKRMNQDFLISEKMLKESLNDTFPLAKQKFKTDYGHYFLESVKRQVHYEKHQNIVTTLQPNLQKIVEKILSYHLSIYNKSAKTPLTGGVVIMDANSGEVLAETGGYDYATQKFDCATQAKRQVGSLFKPFVYLTAFEKGIESSLTFYDQPLEFDGGYKPKNFSGRYYGNVSLEQAFIHSREF